MASPIKLEDPDEGEEETTEQVEYASARKYRELPAPGYKHDYAGVLTDDEVEDGFCGYGSLDFNDMFGAFSTDNFGLVGGARTVDDFSPEGVTDRIDSKELRGNEATTTFGGAAPNTGKRYP